jgi:hypothetical protein
VSTNTLRNRLSGLYYGWRMIGLVSALRVLGGGLHQYGFTVFFLPVTQDLGLTRASTSLCLPANAVRAKLVERAEEWRWSSAYRAVRQDVKLTDFLSPWPLERPQNWIELVNEPDKTSELDELRLSTQRGRPFGSEDWMIDVAKQLGLEATLHPRGRPKRK